jgi:hypothetical protein
METAAFSICFGKDKSLRFDDLETAGAPWRGTPRAGRFVFEDDQIEASMALVQENDAWVLDAIFRSEVCDVTRARWPVELMCRLFVKLGGRLGVAGPEEIDRVTDEPRASRLDLWWSEGCLLVAEDLAGLARDFRNALGARARWNEHPIGERCALLGLPSWFGEDGERSDDRLFSPFHLWLPGFDSNENRYDQLTVTGFGRQWQLADAADAVEALVEKGASAGIVLDPLPLGYPRAAFAANLVNFARTNLVDQFPRAGVWTDSDRQFMRSLIASPLSSALQTRAFVRLSALFTGAVYLRSAAGPLALFWPRDPRRICIGFPLRNEVFEHYICTPDQAYVARLFIEALFLDWGAGAVGNNASLTPESALDEALLQTFPIVVRKTEYQ